MASGARPSSNQRSSVSAAVGDGDVSLVTTQKIHSNGNQSGSDSGKSSPSSNGIVNCMICGGRACSHYYYGVAACHGCKCFFWRSVKQKAQYFCRYNGNCDISENARNSCRYCRFQRCLQVGMHPEAVKTSRDDKQPKSQKRTTETDDIPSPKKKVVDVATRILIEKIKEIEAKTQEEADFNENETAATQNSLQEIFAFPEIMDAFRTRINYCVRLRHVTDEELNFCKFRTLTYAIDYVRSVVSFNLADINLSDQTALLRYCYGSLTIFNLAIGTKWATRESTLLCLPTGVTVSKHEPVVSNSFINHIMVVNIIDSLLEKIEELNITETETLLLRSIIVLNADARGLSEYGRSIISKVRDQLHSALYQQCHENYTEAPLRFANLLHLLPKIMLLARDLIEHIKVSHTFNSEMRRVDPVFFELFGDIFQEERDHIAHVTPRSVKDQTVRRNFGMEPS